MKAARMKNAKEWDSAKNVRKAGEKALEEQRLGSEFEEARGRCAGPFPSLARDPTLQRRTESLLDCTVDNLESVHEGQVLLSEVKEGHNK
jgi:hypothetical protein